MKLIAVNSNDPAHLRVLYALLEQRQSHQSISHRRMPSYEEHVTFVAYQPYLAWYLLEQPDGIYDAWVGAIYLTRRREIGVFLFDDYQGLGLGKTAVQLLMSAHPGEFYANIAPGNLGSQKFFKKLGFRLIQQTYALRPEDSK